MRLRNIFTVLIIAFFLFGCIGSAEQKSQEAVAINTTEQKEVPVVAPSFSIISPTEGQVVDTGEFKEVTIQLSTKNLIITRSSNPKNNEGHFIIYLDGVKMDEVFSKQYVLSNIKKGQHLLEVELVQNDGNPYSPKIADRVDFIAGSLEEESGTYQVAVKDYAYEPAEITIKTGDTITWTNKAQYPRSATDGTASFSTGTIAVGKTSSITFNKVGSYEYYSANYPNMKGKIIVEERE
ncbi:MAG: cupredoxin domain-containing protein [Candidatus Micrarchaeota archaeon]